MECFLARQPILDRQQNLFGYELLFRDGPENWFRAKDHNLASATLISNSSIWFDFLELVQGKRAFINTTMEVLKSDQIFGLPPAHTVIEILETVHPSDELVAVCERLNRSGFTLALDDFIYDPEWDPVLKHIHWIKFDLTQTPIAEVVPIMQHLGKYNISFLAEKVETQAEFDEAMQAGFSLFQGYFFAKPAVLRQRTVTVAKSNYMRLMAEINQPRLDFRKVGTVLSQDAGLSFGLLRFLNSAAFGFKREIRSVQQAVVLLGEIQLRRWVNLALFQNMAEDKPAQLVLQATVRGRFCELLSARIRHSLSEAEFFTGGLFSLMEALMDQPLAEVLGQIPLAEDLKGNLLGSIHGPLYHLVAAIQALEEADWALLAGKAQALKLEDSELFSVYGESIRWAQDLFR